MTQHEPKLPPYQPHQAYMSERDTQQELPIETVRSEHITPIAPLPPAYNGRPHYIHDTTRLTIPQLQPHFNQPSPTFSTVSGKSSHLAVQSWFPPPDQHQSYEFHGGQQSHFSQSSFVGEIPFVMRFRIFVMRWIVEWWLLEIISWTFSALCMITIIGVLFAYDGNEIPDWPLGLTLNGFISALSASAKAALLLPTAEALGQLKWNWFSTEARSLIDFEVLDAASRGPMGSLMLLIKAMREKGLNLASIGAIIVILCLPLDLFFQQIVTYREAFIDMNMNATLPRTTTYRSVGSIKLNGGDGFFADDGMANVVYPFFYSDGVMPHLKSYCPTSNCTWSPFETLAVCSKCQPVPDLLNYGCHGGPAEWTSKVLDYSNSSSWPNMTQCGWFLNETDPATRVLMAGYADNTTSGDREHLQTRLFPLVDVFSYQTYYGGSVHFRDSFADTILDTLVVSWPNGIQSIDADIRPRAEECALTWCTQTLSAGASWSANSENITESYFRNTSMQPNPFVVDSESGQYFYLNNVSITPPQEHTVIYENGSTSEPGQSFQLSNSTGYQTKIAGETVAPLFITSKDGELTYKNKIWSNEAGRGPPMRQIAQNPWSREETLAERFGNIAQAMTHVIRNAPSPDGTQELMLGTSWDQRTHVFIRWGWIILPLFLLLLSLLLLIGTVVKSTREESVVGIWKTSVIAILFNGIDDSVQNSVGPNCRMTEARTRAREFTVKLVPG